MLNQNKVGTNYIFSVILNAKWKQKNFLALFAALGLENTFIMMIMMIIITCEVRFGLNPEDAWDIVTVSNS